MSNTEQQFNRFEVYQEGSPNKRVVGSAFSRDGDDLITLRLWTFVEVKFYVLLSNVDPSRYLIMTREENKNPSNGKKYFWHTIGGGLVDSKNGVVKLQFDIFEKPIFMSLHPVKKPGISVALEKEAS